MIVIINLAERGGKGGTDRPNNFRKYFSTIHSTTITEGISCAEFLRNFFEWSFAPNERKMAVFLLEAMVTILSLEVTRMFHSNLERILYDSI